MARGSLLPLLPVAAVAAVVGAATGTVAAGSVAARSTPSSVATDAASEPIVGPSAPPPLPEGFPNPALRYLPEVTVTQLRDDWLQREPDWNCEKTASSIGFSTTCRPPDSALDPVERYDIDLNIANHDVEPERVTEVTASCELDGPGSHRCRSFFSDVAGLVFGADPALREEASAWARDNTGEDNTTIIGDIRLTAELEPQTIAFTPEPGR